MARQIVDRVWKPRGRWMCYCCCAEHKGEIGDPALLGKYPMGTSYRYSSTYSSPSGACDNCELVQLMLPWRSAKKSDRKN